MPIEFSKYRNESVQETIGDRLRRLMDQSGKTVEDLSLKSGVRTRVIYWIRRTKTASVNFLNAAKLAHAFDKSVTCWNGCDGVEPMSIVPTEHGLNDVERRRARNSTKVPRFNEMLRHMRIRRRLTLKQLASISGVSNSTLAKIEGGQIPRPMLNVVVKIANALVVSVQYFENARGIAPGTSLEAPIAYSKASPKKKRGPKPRKYYDVNSKLTTRAEYKMSRRSAAPNDLG